MNNEVVVVANDIIPGMGMPVAAPGLRAWGIATGLRELGQHVQLTVHGPAVTRANPRPIPVPRPPGSLLLSAAQIGDYVRAHRPRAVVLTNSNHFEALGDLGSTRLVFDFFAPKVLELEHDLDAVANGHVDALIKRKLAALQRCDAVAVNGEKKLPYVAEWLARAGRDLKTVPVVQLPMPIPVDDALPLKPGPIHAVVGGYIQPWSKPGPWAEAIEPMLRDGSLVLHLLIAKHWGGSLENALPETFGRLTELPGVVVHGLSEYGDFRRIVQECHVSIDVFERNAERELAMVTRTLVALSCGLPVIHVPFTETGLLIDRYDAGWTVDELDTEGVRRVIASIVSDRRILEQKRAGVRELGRSVLRPDVATQQLHDVLVGWQ